MDASTDNLLQVHEMQASRVITDWRHVHVVRVYGVALNRFVIERASTNIAALGVHVYVIVHDGAGTCKRVTSFRREREMPKTLAFDVTF